MTMQSLVFIGSLNRETPYFQGARGTGLSVYSLDETTLETALLAETNAIDNPTFFSVTPDGSRIYAASEVFEWREGLVTALAFDRGTEHAQPHQQAADARQPRGPQCHFRRRHEGLGGELCDGRGRPGPVGCRLRYSRGRRPDAAAGQRRPQRHRAECREAGTQPRPQRQPGSRHRHRHRRRPRHRQAGLLSAWRDGDADQASRSSRPPPAPAHAMSPFIPTAASCSS